MRVYIIVCPQGLEVQFSIIGKGRKAPAGDRVDKGADAQKSCGILVQNSFRDSEEARSAGACEGMIETAMLFSPNLPADVRACPPAQGSIFFAECQDPSGGYLDNNPD